MCIEQAHPSIASFQTFAFPYKCYDFTIMLTYKLVANCLNFGVDFVGDSEQKCGLYPNTVEPTPWSSY